MWAKLNLFCRNLENALLTEQILLNLQFSTYRSANDGRLKASGGRGGGAGSGCSEGQASGWCGGTQNQVARRAACRDADEEARDKTQALRGARSYYGTRERR